MAFTITMLVAAVLGGLLLLRPIAGSGLAERMKSHLFDEPTSAQRPVLSIVIPARDEERSLPTLLASLQSQTVQPAEIVVVDDQSQDRTADVAREFGARVITPDDRPSDWLGKPWAAAAGAGAAIGDVLLFLDADVKLEPNAIALLLAAYDRLEAPPDHRPVVSVQPYHRTPRLYERLSLLFNIQVFAGAARRVHGLKLQLEGSCCYGPCILCNTEAYRAIGGHESVKACVLEDIELGSRFRDAGVPVYGFSGRGAVEFRMYPDGLASMIDGFSKNMLLGVLRANPLFFFLDVIWMCGLVAAPFHVALYFSSGLLLEAIVSLLFYTLLAGEVALAGSRLGSFGLLSALLYPGSLLLFLLVLVRVAVLTATGRSVSWKGRPVSPSAIRSNTGTRSTRTQP